MNEEFTGHDDELSDAFKSSDTSNTVDLDKSVEDQAEEAIIRDFFDKEPCCTLGPNKSACWTQAG